MFDPQGYYTEYLRNIENFLKDLAEKNGGGLCINDYVLVSGTPTEEQKRKAIQEFVFSIEIEGQEPTVIERKWLFYSKDLK